MPGRRRRLRWAVVPPCVPPGVVGQSLGDGIRELWRSQRVNGIVTHRLALWAIEHLNHAYRLRCLQQVRIDATDFRGLIGQADVATPPERVVLLNSALKLWRGPVLDGASDALVHTVEANYLRRDRLKTAAALVAAADDPFDVPTQALMLNTLGTAGLGVRLAGAA